MATLSQLLSASGSNSGYIKELYEDYISDPTIVPERWRKTFESLEREVYSGSYGDFTVGVGSSSPYQKRVYNLIAAYKASGHLAAKINPLTQGVRKPFTAPELTLEKHELTNGASEGSYDTNGEFGSDALPLSALVTKLQKRYCGSIGFETEHCRDVAVREFWSKKIAERENWTPSPEARSAALAMLVAAEEFEAGLHKRYVGQKRFSVQGGEAAVALLGHVRSICPQYAIKELVIGMAHRGRLNILCNIAGKPLKKLFAEFEDKTPYALLGAGDVKYHKGYTTTFKEAKGDVTVTMVPNPSHLEFVNPVVEGVARARIDAQHLAERGVLLPIQIHGDAAVIGQGIVPETLNLSGLKGFDTGGTLHLVINNQIGFTTDSKDSRATPYCTDIMKGFDIPVLHVNGEDVDACLWAATAAVEYRAAFKKDVAIDLYCYRKYGHNEGDDPSYTQPAMYAEITPRASVTALYAKKLAAESVVAQEQFEKLLADYHEKFVTAGNEAATAYNDDMPHGEGCALFGLVRSDESKPPKVDKQTLESVVAASTEVPPGFKVHPKLEAILEKRVASISAGGIDWGTAESLAYGTLLKEGYTVRLSGQDAGRGTFSHRHAELTNTENQERYVPLRKLSSNFEVVNSCLSEAAVLGFEFGYAATSNKSLVMWEAQFGDFCNGAQVAIDQFVSSSESKWGQCSGIVLLLPHGYEGQGPEHSSARLERFLQLCAEGNMTVCYPTNGAQIFHLLRKHAYSGQKRPLIVMTPKSLLRLPQAGSSISDFTGGSSFQEILVTPGTAKQKRVVLCSGKVYYDVINFFNQQKIAAQPAVIRLEQLYPFPQEALGKIVSHLDEVIYVQEESRNMGAWNYVRGELKDRFGIDAIGVTRPASASPSAGSSKRHASETEWLLTELKSVLV
jgi:2-oxoglutarate dehydrogenase E1 component